MLDNYAIGKDVKVFSDKLVKNPCCNCGIKRLCRGLSIGMTAAGNPRYWLCAVCLDGAADELRYAEVRMRRRDD
jgi:hypothetical protein